MKKSILIFTLLSLFLCSCDKENNQPDNSIELTEILDIEGTWKWHSTVVGGFVGIYKAALSNPDCTLIFEKGNLISIKDGDEYIIYQEKFKVTKPDVIPLMKYSDIPAGDYLIELSDYAQYVIFNYFGKLVHEIYADGYISISIENNETMLNIIKNPNVEEAVDINYIGSHYVR